MQSAPPRIAPCAQGADEPSGWPGHQAKWNVFERIGMSNFDTDDVKVYKAWLRRTVAVYAGILLLGAATIAAFALTQGPNSTRFLATALSLSAP
jgi:hypothetical protein